MESTEKTLSPLWTRDFTIITLGSVVSMLGNSLSGFAMSLMVLDISQSTLLYAIYIAMYTLPQLIVPIISGAVLGINWMFLFEAYRYTTVATATLCYHTGEREKD